MTSDLCTDDLVVQITTPQIISAEVAALPGVSGAGAAGAGGGAELGRRLLLAARAGDTHAVLDLMVKGAPFTTDWLGTSPLHLAAANAHEETCAVLLRAGVSRDARTKVERTPLHLAAHAGHARVVRLLLRHGANVDCRDMLNMTPLHWAAARGHEAAARALLAGGADARARCKFRKTPRCLALRARAPRLVRLLDDALAQQELAASLRPIADDDALSEESANQKSFETVTRLQEINPSKVKQSQEKNIKIETKPEVRQAAGAGGAAEALLRRHGIALLPADDGSTVLSALQSGRTVVLSDAGKLMLKESGAANSEAGAGPAAGGGGPVLTAKAVKPPAGAGLKVFTLNSLPGLPGAPRKRIINPQDLQQVKIMQLPPDAKLVSAAKVVPLKDKKKPAQRPPVKILMKKSNFERLIATANKTALINGAESVAPSGSSESELLEAVGVGGEAAGAACGACACSARLAAAQRALLRLAAELRDARARLAAYEPRAT